MGVVAKVTRSGDDDMLWLALLAQAIPTLVPEYYGAAAESPAGMLVAKWRACTAAAADRDALVSTRPAEIVAATAEKACEPTFSRIRLALADSSMGLSSKQIDATMSLLHERWGTQLIDDVDGVRASRKAGHGFKG